MRRPPTAAILFAIAALGATLAHVVWTFGFVGVAAPWAEFLGALLGLVAVPLLMAASVVALIPGRHRLVRIAVVVAIASAAVVAAAFVSAFFDDVPAIVRAQPALQVVMVVAAILGAAGLAVAGVATPSRIDRRLRAVLVVPLAPIAFVILAFWIEQAMALWATSIVLAVVLVVARRGSRSAALASAP